jgi:uncharacterized protein YegJ (DUF2314 family)
MPKSECPRPSIALEPEISTAPNNIGWTGWGPRDPEPTTVIALWPDGEAPMCTEVMAALAQSGLESRSDLEAGPASEETLWTAVLRPNDDSPPTVVWAEPAQPMSPGELGDAAAEKCTWIVGFQSVLDTTDPLPSLMNMLKCANTGVRDAPAVLDVNARRWLPRGQLDVMLSEEAPLPPSEMLWTIEVVSRGEEKASRHQDIEARSIDAADDRGGVWLRTQGLARCGRPELEMLEVPEAKAPVAATLLNDIAELLLEIALPEPGEPLEIGVGLNIALQPWSAIGPFLRQEAAGTTADRAARGVMDAQESSMPDGEIAVVCAVRPVGQYRKLWVWPSEVVRALSEDGAAVYRTTRATERAAALAQHTWPELAMTWSRVRKANEQDAASAGVAVILIKVGFEIVSDEAPAREHLWFMVREIAGDQARGQLINEPMHATTMQEGDEVWVNREGVSDWRLILASAIVQPADMLLRSPDFDRALAALEHNS